MAEKTDNGELPHTVDFLLNIIPTSVFSAFAENALLQVLFFAVLFGLALAKIGSKAQVVVSLIDQASAAPPHWSCRHVRRKYHQSVPGQ
ncbi:aerobic C4-dicarboxylate transport protein [Gordonia amarae]|uniref:C4-dicarboxylate transport protein n=1 Tax=Gordonia amarae NBRC 15530 TaxID=1075090 RepID=G7GU47_9ACTN|nr:aerobic C4-dicarboxylate transport protein [Gordonia amarae]GAB07122.1 C4-dicarboxylate transport protein [Gordonia amarae NBRC 15530]